MDGPRLGLGKVVSDHINSNGITNKKVYLYLINNKLYLIILFQLPFKKYILHMAKCAARNKIEMLKVFMNVN